MRLLQTLTLTLHQTTNNSDTEMSHSWSSAPHWKCGIPARVSRVRIPSSPPEKSNAPLWAVYFCVGVAVWTKRSQSVIAGFGARGAKTSHLAKFESYAAKGAHCANVAQMGIRQSLHLRHKNQTPRCGRLFIRPLYHILQLCISSMVASSCRIYFRVVG